MRRDERVTDEMVLAHAKEDAIFAGTEFSALGRADRTRYLERSRRCLSAALSIEQTQPEPVAWRYRHVPTVGWSYSDTAHPRADLHQEPLYAAPLAPFSVDVPTVETQPVAWTSAGNIDGVRTDPKTAWSMWGLPNGLISVPLYAHPPVSALVNAQADADVVERWQPMDSALQAADAYVAEQGIEHSGGVVERAFEAGVVWAVDHSVEIVDRYIGGGRSFVMRKIAALSSLRPAEVGSATSSKGSTDE